MKEILITDIAGMPVLRYIVVDGGFFGGNTHAGVDLDGGPHVLHFDLSMLDLIAQLANAEGHPYKLRGIVGHAIHLKSEVSAYDLARELGIEASVIIQRYGLLVRVTA
jgi:hypothetical protein